LAPVQNPDPLITYAPPPTGRVTSTVLLIVGFGTVGVLLWPFLPGLVLAAVMATLAQPLYHRVFQRLRRPGPAALIATLAVVILLLIPLSVIAILVGTQAVRGIQLLQASGFQLGDAGDGVTRRLGGIASRVGIDPASVGPLLTAQLERIGSTIATRTLGFLSGLGGWLLQLAVAIVTLFYLFRDGPVLIAGLRRSIPLEDERIDRLLERARDVTQATVFGNVLVAMVQGTLGGIAFAMVGLPAATLWGTIMGFLALIPLVGPAVVWVPASIILALSGAVGRALVLAGIGALVIGTVDNILRAVFVGGRARVHSLVVFLSVLGGLFVFGAVGVVVGPVLFVLALLVLEMGRLASEPADRRPPVILSVAEAAEVEPPPGAQGDR
jgi:predicted PurR-regulated permease PerM